FSRDWSSDVCSSDLVYKDFEVKQTGDCLHPDRDNAKNKVPACGSCNVQKGSLPLESFRRKIEGFINSLNLYHTQYAVAKRYGLRSEERRVGKECRAQ